MRKVLISLIVAAIPLAAHAQGAPDTDTTLPLGNNKWLSARTSSGGETQILGTDLSDNVLVNAPSGKSIKMMVAKTPVSQMEARGNSYQVAGAQDAFPVASVITPSTAFPTPNAGDTVSNRFNVIATAAPTAVFVELPAATAVAGQSFTLWNKGANPAQMVPKSGDTVNLVAAATPYACATTKWCECTAVAAGNYQCHSQ